MRDEQIQERLPYYDTGENIQKLIAILGSVLNQIDQVAQAMKRTRYLNPTDSEQDQIDQGTAERADLIATNSHLDLIANNVGLTRDYVSFITEQTETDVTPENDEMLRKRINWNIALQESSGFVNQIKELFVQGLQMYKARTGLGGEGFDPPLEVEDWFTHFAPEWSIPSDHDGTEKRTVEPKDIHIYENQETNCSLEGPDPVNQHGKFGNLTTFYQIDIPWEALPWTAGAESLIWQSQDDFDDPASPPEDTINGWDNGVWGAQDEELVVEPIQILANKTRAAGVQVGIYGNGGMIWCSQDEFANPANPPIDKLHGWNAPMDGDLDDFMWAKENLE